MESQPFYARPVTVTDERRVEAEARAAKQRALKEALDSQLQARQAERVDTRGMTRAQIKRQELDRMRAQEQPPSAPPPLVHQSQSLPSNFMLGSPQHPTSSQHHAPFPPPAAPMYPTHQSHSLPANFSMASVHQYQQQQHAYGHPHHQYHPGAPPPPPAGSGAWGPPPPVPGMYGNGPAYGQQQAPFAPPGAGPWPGSVSSPMRPPPPQHHQQQQHLQQPAPLPTRAVYDIKDVMALARTVTDDPPMAPTAERARRGNDTASGQRGSVSEPTPPASRPGGGRNPSRPEKDARQMHAKVERMQKALEDRQHQVHKMQEKERGWEEQVRTLKAQLKDAQKTQKTRAETAPTTTALPVVPPPKRQLQPLNRPGNAAPGTLRPTRPAKDVTNNAPTPTSGNVPRAQFNDTKVFDTDTFRPITAPNMLEPLVDGARLQSTLPPVHHETRLPPRHNTFLATKRAEPPTPQRASHAPAEEDPAPDDAPPHMASAIALHSRHDEVGGPVCLTAAHIDWCASLQMITQQQGRRLWDFLAALARERLGEEDDDDDDNDGNQRRPTPPPQRGPAQGRPGRTAPPAAPVHAESDEDEDREEDESDQVMASDGRGSASGGDDATCTSHNDGSDDEEPEDDDDESDGECIYNYR